MLEARADSGVPAGAFYAFAGGIGGVALLVGAFFLLRWRRKRTIRRRALENQARQRRLQHASPPSTTPPQGVGLTSTRNGPLPPAYTPTQRDRVRERLPPPRDRLPRLNSSVPRHDTSVSNDILQARLDALAASSGTAPQNGQTNTLAPPPLDPFSADESSAQSDASEFDMERRGPAVNPFWAAKKQAQNIELAAAGYTESEMMLASDQTDDVDEEISEGAGDRGWVGQPIYGGRAVEGIDGIRMQTFGERPKWALPDRPKEAMPSAVGVQKRLPAQTRPVGQPGRSQDLVADDLRIQQRQQTPPPPRHHAPLPTIQVQQPRSDPSLQEQTQPRARPQIARQLVPEYYNTGVAESVDSSRLSQADLAPSSTETEQEEDVRLSRDPWWEEVQANRRAAARGR
ncbi:MAG: hypothetical protein M1835_001040 [Candelina submexicana]|nr:MAG: hypothetical protein M1835_001040 [Candelina submexicana]